MLANVSTRAETGAVYLSADEVALVEGAVEDAVDVVDPVALVHATLEEMVKLSARVRSAH